MKVRNNRTPQEYLGLLLHDVYKISHQKIKPDDITLRLPIS